MTPDHLALGAILMFLLHEAIQFGLITKAGKALADKLPTPNIHTGHDMFDRASNAVLTTSETILKDFLTGPDLTALLEAAATGSPIAVEQALQKDINKLIDTVIEHLGPVVGPLVQEAFGAALRDKISTVLHGLVPQIAVDNHAIAVQAAEAALTAKLVKPLPQAAPGDGSPTVVVAPVT
jgi:hypothetical protein